jgi:hypothetical protein
MCRACHSSSISTEQVLIHGYLPLTELRLPRPYHQPYLKTLALRRRMDHSRSVEINATGLDVVWQFSCQLAIMRNGDKLGRCTKMRYMMSFGDAVMYTPFYSYG